MSTSGNIWIDGNYLTHFEQAIRHIGAIVENPEMYKFITGYKNLMHYARMVKGVSKRKRLEEIIALVGLKERIQR